jgi:glycosyltransferase involved in cell wall biosynthesis
MEIRNKIQKILHIPAEKYPTHQPFLDAVYSREHSLYKSVFLMTGHANSGKKRWNEADVYLIPLEPKFKIVRYFRTYSKIDLRLLAKIPYLVFKEKIDIIQVRDLTFPLAMALVFKWFFKKKVVYQKSHPHEYHKMQVAKENRHNQKFPKLYYWSNVFENFFLHKMMRHADAIFPITSYMADNLINEYHIPRKKLNPFGMGFDFESIPLSTLLGREKINLDLKFVYIGTLALERQFDVLLQGIQKYVQKCGKLSIRFDFIGGTEDEIFGLKNLAAELDITSTCNFMGRFERAEVYKMMPDYDIGISWFGKDIRFRCASPTKLMEYMAFGLPFLATDTVALHSDIARDTGAGIITSVDKDVVCDSIRECIDNFGILKKKSKISPFYIKSKYNYQEMKSEIFELYDKL